MDITFKNYTAKADASTGRFDLYRNEMKTNKDGNKSMGETLLGYSLRLENLPYNIATDMVVQKEGVVEINEAAKELRAILMEINQTLK